MKRFCSMILMIALAALLPGCVFAPRSYNEADSQAGSRIDFDDPLLSHRQIFLFGEIDRQAAELTIQKLLFLDGRNHDPIDLYLQTPGGELEHALAIEQTMRLVQSPVNTCAFSECSSGGVVLLAGGTGKRRAFHGSVIVIHGMKTYGRPPPGFKEHFQDAYTDFWHRRAKLPESWLPLPDDKLHILSAEEAQQYGIVDEIVEK
jgi:ATP-dependent Clp protease protease subunit